jgi:hypothetical protein
LEDFVEEDVLTIDVIGEYRYLGINSKNGIGQNNARVFIRRPNGVVVDGLVPIAVYNDLAGGNHPDPLRLTKANDPSLSRRTWINANHQI